MLTPRGNIHHSKLPKLGEIGYIIGKRDRYGRPHYLYGKKQRYIVESYPLCDNVWPWSHGIHTVTLRSLKDGQRVTVSGFYFEEGDYNEKVRQKAKVKSKRSPKRKRVYI